MASEAGLSSKAGGDADGCATVEREVAPDGDAGACHGGGQKLIPVAEIGTNSGLATDTLRGTGYYKAPSLKGLWYRGQLEHSGAVANLEEWFDPSRLQYNKGHEFGLRLSAQDRFALIAYLRTL